MLNSIEISYPVWLGERKRPPTHGNVRRKPKQGSFNPKIVTIMENVTEKDFAKLAEFINDMYDGDICTFSYYLDKAVYMLHYVEEDNFERIELLDTCFALNKAKECLRQAQRDKK